MTGEDRPAPVLVVCEHASATVPEGLDDLGLAPEDRFSHAAWDIGASALAQSLAEKLDAPLIEAGASRLVLDLNRPPGAADACPEVVEVIVIPGNRNLSDSDLKERFDALYHPFHDLVSAKLDSMGSPALITIHSFTPSWKGQPRSTRIGFLHDADPSLALAAMSHAKGRADVELNAPYSAADGVTHTLAVHGVARGIPNVMVEVRNDLLGDPESVAAITEELISLLAPALEQVR